MLEGQGQFITYFTNEFDVEEMLCVWGYDAIGFTATPTSLKAQEAYNAFAEHLCAFMTNQYHLVRVEMQKAVSGGVQTAEWVQDTEGLVAQDAVPQNTAYIIRKSTTGVGAGKNGRCYIPGVREDNVNSAGTLQGTWPDTVSDSVTLLLAEFDGGDLPLLVVNRGLRVNPLDPPPRVPTEEPDPIYWYIESMACETLVGTQRRRMRP